MTDKNMTTPLLPCPFCGGPASTFQHWGPMHGVGERVGCKNLECFGPCTTAATLEDSTAQWNTRPASPALEGWPSEEALGQLLFDKLSTEMGVIAPDLGDPTRECRYAARAVLRLFASLPRQSEVQAVLAEREACAQIVDGWIGTFQDKNPQHVSAQQWAVDAMEDVAEVIRSRPKPDADHSLPTNSEDGRALLNEADERLRDLDVTFSDPLRQKIHARLTLPIK